MRPWGGNRPALGGFGGRSGLIERAASETLKRGADDEGEILLSDVCASGPQGPYQFYADFGPHGRLKGATLRIESPYE